MSTAELDLQVFDGISVLIVEDHKLFAEAIKWALEQRGARVVGITADADEALDTVRRARPHVVLLDLGLPGASGLSVGRTIAEDHPEVKLVAVTGLRSPRMAKRAIAAGFHAYLTKDTPMRHFVVAISAVLEGQVVLPRRLAHAASDLILPEEQAATALAELLSDREREVLALLVEGLSSRDIAERLRVARNTVRTHVQSILTKLHVHSRLEAAAFAVRYGLVEPPGSDRLG
jgi:two-component system, NarL family, response regulator LiaR